MASVERRQYPTGTKWVVRFRVNGQSRSKTFPTAAAAKAYKVQLEHEQSSTGVVMDPALRKTRLGDWWDQWLESQTFRPNTLNTYQATRRHLGDLADVQLGALRPLDIERWLNELQQADSTKRLHLVRLRTVLDGAVRNGYLAANPASKARSPKRPSPQASASLSDEDVKGIIEAMPRNGSAALLAAVTGMRLGEVAGLRVKDVDWLSGVVHVRQQRDGAPLKSESAERDIPIGRGIVDALGPSANGKDPDDHLFPTGKDIQMTFRVGAKAAGVTARFHDLRAYAASRWIRQGLTVVEVQRLLGHSTPVTTMQAYAKQWQDQSERQREATTEVASVLGWGLQTLT